MQESLLPSPDVIHMYSAQFRDRFGPKVLMVLNGIDLLHALHGVEQKRDSLAYWLEYKNDKELPDIFGGIRGNLNPMKFGIMWDREARSWVAGSAAHRQRISTADAVKLATFQRDELLRGAELLDALPRWASRNDYDRLERALLSPPKTVFTAAWAHKYLTLLYPDKLDNYHTQSWQRFHLIKLLQAYEPANLGRYQAAFYFSQLAAETFAPLTHVTYALNQLHGRPHDYWVAFVRGTAWSEWLNQNFIALGDPGSSDMAPPLTPGRYGKNLDPASMADSLSKSMSEDDLVIATDGHTVFGVGRVTEKLGKLEPTSRWPLRRTVEWISESPWAFPGELVKSLFPLQLNRQRDIHTAIAMEREAGDQQIKIRPPLVQQIQVKHLRCLKDFTIRFDSSDRKLFETLNISVLVGENGMGKTTLLRFLSAVFNDPAQFPGCQATYIVRGESAAVGGESRKPGVRPAKLIVSSYSPFEVYPPSSPKANVPYVHVGTTEEGGLASAHLPLLRAVYHADRALRTSSEEQKRASFETLLEMTECRKQPTIELKATPVLRGEKIVSESGVSIHWNRNFGDGRVEEPQDLDAIDRLFSLWYSAPPLQQSPNPQAKGVSPEQLREYPGGTGAFLADLDTASRYQLSLIEDLWFPRQKQNGLVALSQFSSGEISILYRFFRLLDEMVNDAIVMIDEPETHLHPRWIMRYVRVLTEVFAGYRAHVFLATHSPLIAADLPGRSIIRLHDPKGKVIAEPLPDETLGASPVQVLADVFGITEQVGEFTREKVVKEIKDLIADGQHEEAWARLDYLGNSSEKFKLYLQINSEGRR